MKRILWLSLFLAAAALATPVREIPREQPFQLDSAVACRGQRDGQPVDPGTRFVAERAVYVWFGGRAGARDTPLEAVVTRDDPPRVVAVRRLSVPRGSDGGLVSLTLDGGRSLPTGAYRVSLSGAGCALAVDFSIVPAVADRLECLSEGFSLVPPPGWHATEQEDLALVLVRTTAPEASATVLIRHEPAPALPADVADGVVRAMTGDGGCRVLRRVTTRVAGRPSVALLVDTPDGTVSKIVVVPRDARAFFGLIVSGRADGFAVVEAEFDRMLESFRVVAPRLP